MLSIFFLLVAGAAASAKPLASGHQPNMDALIDYRNGAQHSSVAQPRFRTATRKSIVETAVATPALSTLVTVLTLPAYKDLLAALSGAGPFTVFAPTDAAFAKAGVNVQDVAMVTAILKYHVLLGAIPSSALAPFQSVRTLQGESVLVTKSSAGVFINSNAKVIAHTHTHVRMMHASKRYAHAILCYMCSIHYYRLKVVIPDVMTSNGVVHVVDSVLIPPSILFPAVARYRSIDTDRDAEVLRNFCCCRCHCRCRCHCCCRCCCR
jgi:uncharacterized surface protein with fasciclin (FAS1) repeats